MPQYCQGCTPTVANRSLQLANSRPSITISSPVTFPSNHSVYCSWIVHGPNGYQIKIHFSSFSLKNSTNCSKDAVEIAIPWGLHYYKSVLGRYCGDVVPEDLLSSKNSVIVTYTASSGGFRTPHQGFHVSLTLAPAGEKIKSYK